MYVVMYNVGYINSHGIIPDFWRNKHYDSLYLIEDGTFILEMTEFGDKFLVLYIHVKNAMSCPDFWVIQYVTCSSGGKWRPPRGQYEYLHKFTK